MPEPTASPELPEDLSFEQAVRRLEEIVEMLEQDPPDLETALQLYEEGVLLARHCLQRLDAAELRVQELALE
ncbi:exodeoxyribonuclease VII small subunit [Rhodocaloribacter sp.]